MKFEAKAAILCSHVARAGVPILLAIRTEPEDNSDSGWQFFCNTSEREDWEQAQVWAVSEVVEMEPSFLNYVNSPVGTKLMRESATSKWRKLPA